MICVSKMVDEESSSSKDNGLNFFWYVIFVGSISLLGAAVAGTIGACTGANWDDVEEIIDYACMDEPEEDPKQRSQAFEDLVNSEAYQNWLNNLRYNSGSKGGSSATVQ